MYNKIGGSMNKNENHQYLISKLCLIVLMVSYLAYFIYCYVTKDFDFNNKLNIFKLVLIFISLVTLGITLMTSNGICLFFSVLNYTLIVCLIGISVYEVFPTSRKEKEPKEEKEEIKEETVTSKSISCHGKTEISDYTDDKIDKLIYTYTFTIEKEKDAQEIVKKFNDKYNSINEIYGEINIDDNVTVILNYNLKDINLDDHKDIIEEKLLSYNSLKETDLTNLTCEEQN